MICFEIFEVLKMYVLKSGLTWTSTSSHSSISSSACISWDRDPLHRVYWNSHWRISSSLGPRFLCQYFTLERIVFFSLSCIFRWQFSIFPDRTKNNFNSGNNILVLACLVSLWVTFFFNLPNWSRKYKLVTLRHVCNSI